MIERVAGLAFGALLLLLSFALLYQALSGVLDLIAKAIVA